MGFIIGVILIVLYNLLKKLFSKDKSKAIRAKGSLFYHEDTYCNVQLLPIENFDLFKKQVKEINAILQNESNQFGYDEILVREENIELIQRKIQKKELELLFKKLQVKKHLKVVTGYGRNYRVKSKNTIGYGTDYSAIYYHYKNSYATKIWMTNIESFDKEKVIELFLELGKKWHLALVNWKTMHLVNLKNKEEITRYLS